LVLRDILVKEFDEKAKNKKIPSIKTNKKAMTKLLREAQELKEQLSASPTLSVIIEDLYEGIDFQTTITRETLEKETEKLVTQVVEPLKKLLTSSVASSNPPTVIELFGGGVRIPKIQQAITALFPSIPIGKHIDGDEAAVFGAGQYLGAVMGLKRVGNILLKDNNNNGELNTENTIGELDKESEAKLKNKLDLYEQKTKAKKEAEEARNKLEAWIMGWKEKLGTQKLKKTLKEQGEEFLSNLSNFLDENDALSLKAQQWTAKLEEAGKELFSILGVKEETEAEKRKKQEDARAKEDATPKRKKKRASERHRKNKKDTKQKKDDL